MPSKFWTIVKNTFLKNVKSVSFLIMLLSPIALGLIIYIVGSITANQESVNNTCAVVTSDPLVKQALKATKGDVKVVFSDETQAMKRLKDEKVGFVLLVKEKDGILSGETKTDKSISASTTMTIQAVLNAIQKQKSIASLHLSGEQVTKLQQEATLKQTYIEFDKNGKTSTTKDYTGIRSIVALILVILIWTFVATYGGIIAQEIANEKGTRIMEVILSSVKAETHFYGKLVGISLVCLLNIAVYALQLVVFNLWFKSNTQMVDLLKQFPLDKIFTGQFWLVIPIIILGILLFIFLSTLAGSLISRIEDVPKASQPLVMIGLVGYIICMMFQQNPDHLVMKICAYVPFVSSFVLPMRIANNVAPTSEISISMGIMVITMVATLLFSAKLYRSNVLIYNDGGMFQTLKQSIANVKAENNLKKGGNVG